MDDVGNGGCWAMVLGWVLKRLLSRVSSIRLYMHMCDYGVKCIMRW